MARKSPPPFQPGPPSEWGRPAPRLRRRQLLRGATLSLLGLAAVGVLGWFLYQDFTGRGDQADIGQGGSSQAPVRAPRTADPEGQARARDPDRTAQILTCTAADGSTYYTNARTCEAADLDNRVNVMPAVTAAPAEPAGSGTWDEARACLAARLRGERQVRLLPACSEPFQEALDLERNLARADDPVDSRRAQDYCDLIAEGAKAGCPATSELFCYLAVCQQRVAR